MIFDAGVLGYLRLTVATAAEEILGSVRFGKGSEGLLEDSMISKEFVAWKRSKSDGKSLR